MISQIPYNKILYRKISEQLKAKETEAGGKDKLPHAKVKIKGKVVYEPFYKFRTDEVYFNKTNGRIKSEVLEKEAQLGRELNETNLVDQNILRELLLEIKPEENEKLREDLLLNEQIEPGIMTCDGILINGNRRKAVLEKYLSNVDEKYRYIDVHVLPQDIKRDELWLIEAGIQLSAPQQLDYSPINNLLKIKEGIDSGLDISVMASRIYGMSIDKLKKDLDRLELINEYLNIFIDKPGKYYLVKNLAEHFIDLQNIYEWAKNPRGRIQRNWVPDESEIEGLKLIGFYYIRGRFQHLRIRELRNLFALKESWKDLKKALKISNKLTKKELEEVNLDTNESEIEDENYNENENENTNQAEKRDFAEERKWYDKNIEKLKNHFEDSKEKFEIKKNEEEPLTLVKRALSNLKGIPKEKGKLSDPKIDATLKDIIEVTNKLRKIIKKKH